MAQRITWQNVAAPDFDGVLRARAAAAEMFDRAASGIGGAFKELDTRNVDQSNNMAIAEALKIQDAGSWDSLMAGQGVAGLGLDPTRVNQSTLDFARKYRTDLTNKRETDRQYAEDVFDDNKAQYDFGRAKTADARLDAQLAASDALNAKTLEARKAVFDLVPSTASKEDLVGLVENLSRERGYDPEMFGIMMNEAGAVDEKRWMVGSDIRGTGSLTPEARVIKGALDARENAFNIELGTDRASQLYSEAVKGFSGYNSPAEGLVDGLLGKVDPNSTEEDKGLFSKSAGAIQDTFNGLVNDPENKGIPPNVIALVLKNNLQSDGIVFSGDQLKFDKSAVDAELSLLRDPKARQALEAKKTAIENAQADMSRDRAQYQKAVDKWELATDNKDAAGVERALADMAAISSRIGVPPNGVAADDPAAALTASARGGLPVGGQPALRMPGSVPQGVPLPVGPVGRGSPGVPLSARAAPQLQGTPVAPSAPAFVDPGIDPSIASSSQAIRSGIGTGLWNIGQTIDDGFGDASAFVNRLASGAGMGLSHLIGAFSPSAGSAVMRGSNAVWDQADILAREGFVSGVPTWQDQANLPSTADNGPIQLPISTVPAAIMKEVKNDPLGAIVMLADESNLEPGLKADLTRSAEALKTGISPETGQPLTDLEKKQYKRKMELGVGMMKRNYEPKGDNDPIMALIDNPDEWLK